MRHFAFLFGFAFTSACFAAPVKVQSYSGDTSLPHKLLISAIERADLEYVHPYETNKDISNARILNDVKNNQLDVMWSMTSTQLEQDYQAVYIPLFRGLLGMRVAIVKAQNRELFSSVTSLQDLKRFTAGQGKTWPDTKILKANQLPVVTTLKYPNLFPMLEGERFDYFPRGVNEPWDEIANHSALNLTVEPHLVIKYTAPLYFFVNKNNHTLHKQLNDALNEMIADGTFNAMFLADSQVQTVLSKANLSSRRVIELDNPTLSSNTPNKNSPLWFNPFQ
ncbi:substrate-binding periplasmic protein [Pseudoalteromonas gelatinilytica]|uniref:Solute-binding protein family 3/N-terminal domain-containing protein n=1 Tax=Pseudoalteromonas gelatinilytica TaxID=1703256 RepID=A0ABQ1T4G0_9GAMM|nr:transporter substrate-binding domain-containing protein [Pseudoalteromonas profundi]GGE79773.1 hypothetical protein GCM10008027_00530 [Pseudoalteromonas profundi]